MLGNNIFLKMSDLAELSRVYPKDIELFFIIELWFTRMLSFE